MSTVEFTFLKVSSDFPDIEESNSDHADALIVKTNAEPFE